MKRIVMVFAAFAVLLLPSAALADSSPTCQSYSPQLCQVVTNTTASQTQSLVSTGPTTSAASAGSGTLPFTGLDVVLLTAGGATLLGAGLIVRRMSRGIN